MFTHTVKLVVKWFSANLFMLKLLCKYCRVNLRYSRCCSYFLQSVNYRKYNRKWSCTFKKKTNNNKNNKKNF